MANVKYFRLIGRWRGFTKDDKSDTDEDPQFKGVNAGVTITASTSKNRQVMKASTLSPNASLISLWPIEARLDDGRLKVFSDSEDPAYDQPDVKFVANCPALGLDSDEQLIYTLTPHDATANGGRVSLPSMSFIAPFVPESHNEVTDGEVRVDWAQVEWLEQGQLANGGTLIRNVPDGVVRTGLTIQFMSGTTPLGDPIDISDLVFKGQAVDITDSTAVGRAVLTALTPAAARDAIGAGTGGGGSGVTLDTDQTITGEKTFTGDTRLRDLFVTNNDADTARVVLTNNDAAQVFEFGVNVDGQFTVSDSTHSKSPLIIEPDAGAGALHLGTADNLMGQLLDMGGNKIRNVADPVNNQDVVTKAWALANLDGSGGSTGPSNTDDLPEGTANLYYTQARVDARADARADAKIAAAIGTTVQAYDSDISGIAALVIGNSKALFKNSSGNWATTDLTDFARTILDDPDAATVRATIGAQAASEKGAPNGIAPLDSTSLIPAVYLPSYVDDVLEFTNLAAFPSTGETGKIYVDKVTAKIYRWTGSTYVEISPSPGSTDAVPEGATNLYYTQTRADARADTRIAAAVGVTVQGLDPELTALAGLTSAANKLPYFNGSASATLADFTGAARALLDDPDAASMRTTLGLGAAATKAGNVAVPVWFEVHATYNQRSVGYGDNTLGFLVPAGFTLTSVVYRGETADASGSTSVELRKNGTQIASTVKTITSANQWTYGPNVSVTGLTEVISAGDILRPYVSAVGGATVGKGFSVVLIGTTTVTAT